MVVGIITFAQQALDIRRFSKFWRSMMDAF